ncbi:MAG: FecR domain-containing protein [Bryobacteraceae bacterium]
MLILCCSLTFPAAGAEPIAGSVKTLHGGVVVRRGGQTIPAHEGMHLLVDDILQTAADGRLGAILQDGTGIGLGPNTELKIDSFVYEPAGGKLGLVLRLAKGLLAYFSGGIARLAPGSVTVETPVGVIGLRGTHMAVSIGGT